MSLNIKFPALPEVEEEKETTTTDETDKTTDSPTATDATVDTTQDTKTDTTNEDEAIANTVTKPEDVAPKEPEPVIIDNEVVDDIPAEILATVPKLEEIKVEEIKVVIPEV